MARVAIARRVRQWLVLQAAYLLLHNPRGAERLERRLADAIRLLGEFPRGGAPARTPGTRRLIMPPYVFTYREHGDDVVIIDIRHGHQRETRLTEEC